MVWRTNTSPSKSIARNVKHRRQKLYWVVAIIFTRACLLRRPERPLVRMERCVYNQTLGVHDSKMPRTRTCTVLPTLFIRATSLVGSTLWRYAWKLWFGVFPCACAHGARGRRMSKRQRNEYERKGVELYAMSRRHDGLTSPGLCLSRVFALYG